MKRPYKFWILNAGWALAGALVLNDGMGYPQTRLNSLEQGDLGTLKVLGLHNSVHLPEDSKKRPDSIHPSEDFGILAGPGQKGPQ